MPDDIIEAFKQHWTGTDIELVEAMDQFYQDIRGSVQLAMENMLCTANQCVETLTTVDDYVANHYGES